MSKRSVLEQHGYSFRNIDMYPYRLAYVEIVINGWIMRYIYDGESEDEFLIEQYLVDKAWEHYKVFLSDGE